MDNNLLQKGYSLIDTVLSIIRLLLKVNVFATKGVIKSSKSKCIILGNGPSLVESLTDNKDKLADYDLVALNFMGLSDVYKLYKPGVYVFSDPAFWFETTDTKLNDKVKKLLNIILCETDWPIQVFFPFDAKRNREFVQLVDNNGNSHVKVKYYHKTKFEGFAFLRNWVYNRRLGMPRSQNVVISALMLSVTTTYDAVYLLGAENDWIKNLWVDDRNRLRLNDTHFYDENNNDGSRILKGVNLYDQYCSLSYVLKSYSEIYDFASKRNVKIFNATPNSYIDIFERKKISI